MAAFEQQMAAYVGVEHAVAVSNCTAALHLALLALGVGKGDRVAVTAYSWPSTANVIILCGAEPVFVDIDPKTFNMDPEALSRELGRTTVRAILPVHAFGGMADMAAICEIAGRRGVPVIEDAACALGASLHGRQAGSWGAMGCFSFHPRKSITTGEGGLITTNDASFARKLRILRNHGLDPAAPKPDFVDAGYNLRLTEFQAALGSSQLRKLDRITISRIEGAERYTKLFSGTEVSPPAKIGDSRHVYQSCVMLLPLEAVSGRADLIAALKAQGIETAIGTYHMPLIRFFRDRYGYCEGNFPKTDEVASRALTVPLFEGITLEQQRTVAETLLANLPIYSAAANSRA